MCHPELPEGAISPEVAREEISVTSSLNEQIPTLLTAPMDTPRGAIVVIADIGGRSPFYEDLAARLSIAGYAALLPELFFRQGPPEEPTFEAALARRAKLDDAQALRDLTAIVGEARRRAGASLVGTIGFCMGGTFVLQLAAQGLSLASVCYYGFPARGAPSPLELSDRIEGPLIGFWGDQDEAVGMDNVERLFDVLTRRGVDASYTIYPRIGHGFMAASRLDPASPEYEPACASWTRTIGFFREHVA